MNMEIIGPIFLSLISGLSTILGSFFIFLKIKKVGEFITFSLSLSMSILLFISIFELIPNSIKQMTYKYSYSYGIIISALIFLLGYQTVYFINKRIDNSNSLYKIGILNMISIILHNFPEGILVFISAYHNISIGIKLCIAIIIHNIPEGIIISVPLYYSTNDRGRVVVYTLIAGLSEPLGALLSYLFLKDIITNDFIAYILLFVSGIMISLALNEILKEILSYNNKKYMIFGLITGIIISIIILNI